MCVCILSVSPPAERERERESPFAPRKVPLLLLLLSLSPSLCKTRRSLSLSNQTNAKDDDERILVKQTSTRSHSLTQNNTTTRAYGAPPPLFSLHLPSRKKRERPPPPPLARAEERIGESDQCARWAMATCTLVRRPTLRFKRGRKRRARGRHFEGLLMSPSVSIPSPPESVCHPPARPLLSRACCPPKRRIGPWRERGGRARARRVFHQRTNTHSFVSHSLAAAPPPPAAVAPHIRRPSPSSPRKPQKKRK